eukprot:362984-Chlamydomonas_euryale.AAC.7
MAMLHHSAHAMGCEPTLQMVSRARSNQAAQQVEAAGAASLQTQGTATVTGLREKIQSRSLLANQASGAYSFARVFCVLEVVHELLRTGRQATQRDVYYKLSGFAPALFGTAKDVNTALQVFDRRSFMSTANAARPVMAKDMDPLSCCGCGCCAGLCGAPESASRTHGDHVRVQRRGVRCRICQGWTDEPLARLSRMW